MDDQWKPMEAQRKGESGGLLRGGDAQAKTSWLRGVYRLLNRMRVLGDRLCISFTQLGTDPAIHSFTVASGPPGPLPVTLSFNPAGRTFGKSTKLCICPMLHYFDFQIGVYIITFLFYLWKRHFLSAGFVCMKSCTYGTDVALVLLQLLVSSPATYVFLLELSPEIQVLAGASPGRVTGGAPTCLGLGVRLAALVSVFSSSLQPPAS